MNPLLREDRGSALPAVLFLLTVLSTLVGIVLSVSLQQRRFIQQDIIHLQARYAAEAGLYLAAERLAREPTWRPRQASLEILDDYSGTVTVEPFGGFYAVTVTARLAQTSKAPARRERPHTARALLAQPPTPSFDAALVLGNTQHALNLAGHTEIQGPLHLGERGYRTNAFKGRPFEGTVDGTVHERVSPGLPPFDDALFRETIDQAEALLALPPATAIWLDRSFDAALSEEHAPSDAAVYASAGSYRLTPADSQLLRHPVTILVQGTLTLQGPLHLTPGSRFFASGAVHVQGPISGRGALLYGREAVDIGEGTGGAMQIFTRKQITITGPAMLRYPSVAYVTGPIEAVLPEEPTDSDESDRPIEYHRPGRIELTGPVTFDGALLYPPLSSEAERTAPDAWTETGRITIGPEARLRGALYSAHQADVRGTIAGTVLTQELYLFETPTTYINWLLDATLAVEERPDDFLIPVGFGTETGPAPTPSGPLPGARPLELVTWY